MIPGCPLKILNIPIGSYENPIATYEANKGPMAYTYG